MNKYKPWPNKLEDLTPGECEYIRHLRVESNCSWRLLSELFCEKFYPEADSWPKCAGNQLHGEDLCNLAAEFFNENPNEEPWN